MPLLHQGHSDSPELAAQDLRLLHTQSVLYLHRTESDSMLIRQFHSNQLYQARHNFQCYCFMLSEFWIPCDFLCRTRRFSLKKKPWRRHSLNNKESSFPSPHWGHPQTFSSLIHVFPNCCLRTGQKRKNT